MSAGLFYYIVFPIAAWNHNMPLAIIAALFPLGMNYLLAIFAGVPMRGTDAQRAMKIVGLAVFGFLLWNHLWIPIMLLWVGLVLKNSITKK